MNVMDLQMIVTKPTDFQVVPLIEALSNELGLRFGDTGKNSFQQWDDGNEKFVFIKAICNDEVVGCGAIRPISDEIAEVKRMYSKYNRQGIGKSVLIFLENKARELGYKEIWLETRKLNLEACSFYVKNGYKEIPNFGKYVGKENAICFGKLLETI